MILELLKMNGLIEATRNHERVVVFYLYKQETYKNQEAQKWWLSQSLLNFQKKLNNLNINLEIIETNSFKIFFDKLIKKKDFQFIGIKFMNQIILKFDEYLSSNLKKKIFTLKDLKEMLLMKLMKLKKMMALHLKYSHLFGEQQKNIILRKVPSKEKIIKKCKKKINYFKNCIETEKILPKKKWFKNFEKIWLPDEQSALKELQNFIKEKNYLIILKDEIFLI